MYFVATIVEPGFSILFAYPFCGGLDNAFQRLLGADLDGAQPDFEFAKCQSNELKVGRVGWQVQQAGPAGFDELG